MRPDKDVNKELYGKEIENREVVATAAIPKPAEPLLQQLNKYSSRK
jgi:hypothetical protein